MFEQKTIAPRGVEDLPKWLFECGHDKCVKLVELLRKRWSETPFEVDFSATRVLRPMISESLSVIPEGPLVPRKDTQDDA